MNKKDWIWMPHAGHFILGHMCRFRLNTFVGKYIVSTVGEYVPDGKVRDIIVSVKKDKRLPNGDWGEHEYIRRYGYEPIGCDRTYETMIFKSKRSKEICCPYVIDVKQSVDAASYNTAKDAYKGHLALCNKWSRR